MFNSYNNSPPFVKKFVDTTIEHEGGDKYTDIKEDSGGETRYGVTKKAALAKKQHWHLYDWNGDMKTLPLQFAQDLYVDEYYLTPKFNLVAEMSQLIAEELFDTGINVGHSLPSKWLQQLLNILNNQQKFYNDITVDGKIGNGTCAALKSYLSKRGKDGERVLHNMLNIMQGSHYINLALNKESQETFIYGWLNRVNFK